MSNSYCTLADVKLRLNISDTTDDTLLGEFITQASGWIESKTGRQFAPEDSITRVFDGINAMENGRILLIPRGIRAITTLQNGLYTGATLQTIPSTDYFLQPSPYQEPGWPYTEVHMTDIPSSGNPAPYFAFGYSNISITGNFGWSATPSEINDIALSMVVSMWRARSAAGGETVTIGSTGERVIERALTYEQRLTLSRYTWRSISVV